MTIELLATVVIVLATLGAAGVIVWAVHERRRFRRALARFPHPWLVVDTHGTLPAIGCWTEEAARRLPAQITAPVDAGRWVVQPNPAARKAQP